MRHLHPEILLCLAIAAGAARADDLPWLKSSWKEQDASVVAFSPDGKSVLSAGKEGLRLRDAATGEVRIQLSQYPFATLQGPAFSPNSGTLFTLGSSERHLPLRTQDIKVWSVANGNLLDTIPYVSEGMSENCYALSEDGKTLAFIENSRRLPVRLKTSEMVLDRLPPTKVAYNASTGLPRVKIWDVSRWEAIAIIEGREPLAFSKDGKFLATGDSDWHTPIAKLWDAKTGKLVSEFKDRPPGLFPLAFSPDGRFLAADGFEGKSLWEVATGRRWAIDAKGSGITSKGPRFSADGKLFFPNGTPWMHPNIGQIQDYYCFDISEMPPKRLDLGPGEIIISQTGDWYAAVQGERGTPDPRAVVLRELPSRRELGRFDATGLDGGSPSTDGRWLAIHTWRHDIPAKAAAQSPVEILLVDTATARVTAAISPQEQTWGSFQWKFSPNSKSLAIIYRTGSNAFQPGEPDPSDRPMNVDIWELPRH